MTDENRKNIRLIDSYKRVALNPAIPHETAASLIVTDIVPKMVSPAGPTLMIFNPARDAILDIVRLRPDCWTPKTSTAFANAVYERAGAGVRNAAAEFISEMEDKVLEAKQEAANPALGGVKATFQI